MSRKENGWCDCLFLMAVVVIVQSCATVEVKRIKNNYGSTGIEIGNEFSGLRYYRPALFVWITESPPSEKIDTRTVEQKTDDKTKVLITSSTKKKVQAKIVVLPDFTQEYAITWKSGIGSVKPAVTLKDGWNLTALTAEHDSKVSEMTTAIAEPIATVVSAAFGALTDGAFTGYGLYKLKIDDKGKISLGEKVLGLN